MKKKYLLKLLPLTALMLALAYFSWRHGSLTPTSAPATEPSAIAAAEDTSIPPDPPVAAAVPAPEQVVAMEQLPLSPDLRWQQPSTFPPMADFQKWAALPADQRDPEVGVKLAEHRRAAMRPLIEQDPAQAIANAVPESVRRTLPAAVQALLEEKVDGRGDLMVTAIYDEHAKRGTRLVKNTVTLHDGREFEAFVYGNREYKPSREDIPLHGIALDGKMAVSEWPGRVLEPVEITEAKQAAGVEPVCPISEKPVAETGTETALITGN